MSFVTGTQTELLYAMPSNGGAVTVGSTLTTGTAVGGPLLIGNQTTNPPFQLPAYFFPDTYGVGKAILIEGGGIFTTGSLATQTMKFGLWLNAVSGTPLNSLGSTGIFTVPVTTTGIFMFRAIVTCTAVGSAGTLNCSGRLDFGANGVTTTTGVPSYLLGAGTTTPASFNNGLSYYIEPFAYWGTSSTSPSMTLTNYYVWGLN